jgi:hypothetical protein
MVARNFSFQDLPLSSRLLSVPDDDEREFLTLEELKPHHLTELVGGPQQINVISSQHHHLVNDFSHSNIQLNQSLEEPEYNVYYDLNAQQSKYAYG